jgi:hypothetical protein
MKRITLGFPFALCGKEWMAMDVVENILRIMTPSAKPF